MESQFARCLDQSFQIVLSPEEEAILLRKYEDKPGGNMVNYQKFADVIDCIFQPDQLKVNPMTQKIEPEEFLGSKRSLRPLSPATKNKITEIVERIAPYYKYHGINIRTCYEDFDRHHIGVVTESQFHRSFPKPIGLNDEELSLLVRGYLDPERPGLCNYLNFHNDVEAIKRRMD
ncbi:uncharacterized protein [Amphiura filiformis]|uniref:uncharacterized protein n=1 Tax=Amphiura filiformis TaxID=82378 RepID=UPI003B228136